MNISGYQDTFPDGIDLEKLLVDGWDLVTGPAFWAAHLLRQGYDEDVILPGFGVEEPAAQEVFDRLAEADRWPAFRIEVDPQRSLVVVYRNLAEDAGVDYLLESAGRDAVLLSALEGSFRGPGISWLEILRVSRRSGADGIDGRKLLLLWPMSGDTAAVPNAGPVVAEALREVGAAGDLDELTELLVEDHPMWDLPSWTVTSTGSLINDGDHSPRNPAGPAYGGTDFSL
jgi:hypothetical protein